jgi:hypothetical protein
MRDESFSTVWKNRPKVVPLCGKFAQSCSIAWKKQPRFSTVWKIPPTRDELFFHSVELFLPIFPQRGKPTITRAIHRVRLSYRIAEGCARVSGKQKSGPSLVRCAQHMAAP